MSHTLKKTILFTLLGLICIVPLVSLAQTDYTPLAPLPSTLTVTPGTIQDGASRVQSYFQNIYTLLIAGAAALAIVMIIIGGIQYIAADAWTNKSGGKEKIKNAVFGLILVIGAWLLLYTINPELVGEDPTRIAVENTEVYGDMINGEDLAISKVKNEPNPAPGDTLYIITSTDSQKKVPDSLVKAGATKRVYTTQSCSAHVSSLNKANGTAAYNCVAAN